MHNHLSFLQILKCFGVGSGLVIGALVIMGGFSLWADANLTPRIDSWFEAHPRLLKCFQVAGIVFMVACICVLLFALGCSILEGK